MTTKKLTLNIRKSDQYTTEPQSVLEKLKRFRDCGEFSPEIAGLSHWYCDKFLHDIIAALELVEAKAMSSKSGIDRMRVNDGKIDFAREVLAVVNGETKGE